MAPDTIVLPELRTVTNFMTAPCKQEVSLMRKTRHARQVSNLFKEMDPVRQTLMRVTAGQCGRDTAQCSLLTVRAVATMDCSPDSLAHAEASEASLFCASTLHRYGLPHDYAKLEHCILPEMCPCCYASLWGSGLHATRADRIFVWQS